jgi:hypothetical protein
MTSGKSLEVARRSCTGALQQYSRCFLGRSAVALLDGSFGSPDPLIHLYRGMREIGNEMRPVEKPPYGFTNHLGQDLRSGTL